MRRGQIQFSGLIASHLKNETWKLKEGTGYISRSGEGEMNYVLEHTECEKPVFSNNGS